MTATTALSFSAAPIKTREGVIKVRSSKSSIKKISENGVYVLVEVHHPDGSRSRIRVPSRSIEERIAEETTAAQSKAVA